MTSLNLSVIIHVIFFYFAVLFLVFYVICNKMPQMLHSTEHQLISAVCVCVCSQVVNRSQRKRGTAVITAFCSAGKKSVSRLTEQRVGLSGRQTQERRGMET